MMLTELIGHLMDLEDKVGVDSPTRVIMGGHPGERGTEVEKENIMIEYKDKTFGDCVKLWA